MKFMNSTRATLSGVLLLGAAAAAMAQASHFEYAPKNAPAGQATFVGGGSGIATGAFTVLAPQPKKDGLFPTDKASATATIEVKGIEKVGDDLGNALVDGSLNPVSSQITGALYDKIKDAFAFSPSINSFSPNDILTVNVTIHNPNVGSGEYGDYLVKVKAIDQETEPAAGIGEGSGVTFLLKLRATSDVDIVPPTVSISAPPASNILGEIAVSFSAEDPAPGTGLASMSASIKSAGGISFPVDSLTLSLALPQPDSVSVTANGFFHPIGWSGPMGTTLANAFTLASPSGIGNYTLTAMATDVAGNVGSSTSAFGVNYNVVLTVDQIGGDNRKSTGRVEFTAQRLDNAFMFDKTVVVKVFDMSNYCVATHSYGTTDIKSVVQLGDDHIYRSHFVRESLKDAGNQAPSAKATYTVKVYFRDVDGNLREQGSATVQF